MSRSCFVNRERERKRMKVEGKRSYAHGIGADGFHPYKCTDVPSTGYGGKQNDFVKQPPLIECKGDDRA